MPRSHDGRVAIVTGAAHGIGQAIAIKLAERGAQLVLVDIGDTTETAARIGKSALCITADVSKDADWDRVGAEVDRRFGRADIVVNNAAYYPHCLSACGRRQGARRPGRAPRARESHRSMFLTDRRRGRWRRHRRRG